ncbi:hypothetical protein ACT4R9_09905 [Ornithobacterium rhinotracheale]|uniref:hypothetical protein n=1 Tax=Ornithobacterium rhinotracheale TaxID=28251 RepID=UPI003FA410C2
MKNLFLLVLAFSYSAIFGQQKLEGTYGQSGDFYQGYTFSKDGTFEYISGGCLGVEKFGKGHYSVQGDSLKLNFDLTQIPTHHHIVKKNPNNADSVVLKIKILDALNQFPLYDTNVALDSTMINPYLKTTNSLGELKLKLPRKNEISQIHISQEWTPDYHFVGGYTLSFDRNFDNEITVYIANENDKNKYIQNTIKTFKIKKLNKDELVLEGGKFDLKLRKEKTK